MWPSHKALRNALLNCSRAKSSARPSTITLTETRRGIRLPDEQIQVDSEVIEGSERSTYRVYLRLHRTQHRPENPKSAFILNPSPHSSRLHPRPPPQPHLKPTSLSLAPPNTHAPLLPPSLLPYLPARLASPHSNRATKRKTIKTNLTQIPHPLPSINVLPQRPLHLLARRRQR